MIETAEVLTDCVTYDIEDARRDAAQLHKLNRKATLATGMIDAEIAELQKDLQLLEARKEEILKPLHEEMMILQTNLTEYHRRELEAGGDKTIKLPWATLKSKAQPQDYVRDDTVLLHWVQINAPEYVKVAEPTVAWGELKKAVVVAGNKALWKETGEVIDGLAPKGNLSGVAIEFKLIPLEQKCMVKENKFRIALAKRRELLTEILNIRYGKGWDYREITEDFTRNIPQNIKEDTETVVMLDGIISKRTLLELLPQINDVDQELERIQEEESELAKVIYPELPED